jgi:hypothetical protein
MRAFGLFVSAALLSWTSLIHARLHTPRRGTLWLPMKLAAASFELLGSIP